MDIRVAQYTPVQAPQAVTRAAQPQPVQQPVAPATGPESGQGTNELTNALRTIANNEGRGKLVDIMV